MVGVRSFVETMFGRLPSIVGNPTNTREQLLNMGKAFDDGVSKMIKDREFDLNAQDVSVQEFKQFLDDENLTIMETQYKAKMHNSVVTAVGDVLCLGQNGFICIELKTTSLSSVNLSQKYGTGQEKKFKTGDTTENFIDSVLLRTTLQLYVSMRFKNTSNGFIYYHCIDNISVIYKVSVLQTSVRVQELNSLEATINLPLAFFEGVLKDPSFRVYGRQAIRDLIRQRFSKILKSRGPQRMEITLPFHKFGKTSKIMYTEAIKCAKHYNLFPKQITINLKKRKRYSSKYEVVKVINID